MGAQNLQQKLDAVYNLIETLSPDSPSSKFEEFAAFFAPNAKAWLKNMREYDSLGVGRQEIINKLKSIMTEKHWRIAEREVIASAVSADGSRLFCETRKRLDVCGQPIDPFPEVEIAVFNAEGLITELRLYCCWSPIASVIQQVTGGGPYASADYKSKVGTSATEASS